MCDLDELDRSAQQTGTNEDSRGAQPCPQWTVRVTVKSTVDTWPDQRVRVWLQLREGSLWPADKYTRMEAKTSAPVEFLGRGAQTYMARASTPGHDWKFVEQRVRVDGTQTVEVELALEPTHFVAFKLLDDATDEPVTGLTFKLTLPGNKAHDLEITDAETGEHAVDLRRNDPTEVVSLEVPGDDIWEVVALT